MQRFDLSMLFINHDLAVVRTFSDRVLGMHLGKVCDVASVDDLLGEPKHPYTSLLLRSIPRFGHPYSTS